MLLQYKGELHDLARKLGDEDLRAIRQFVLISLVILLVVPNRAYSPYAVLSPREIWWMVVLIVGLTLAVSAAKAHFGDKGLYVVAAFSGLTDVDAITLSTAQLVGVGRLDPGQGWRIIVIGLMSNVCFKGATIAAIGHKKLLSRVILCYGIGLVSRILLVLVWP